MVKVKLSDFKVVPDINSVHRECISDEQYFSEKYAHMLSSTRIKHINPEEGGSIQKYLNPEHKNTDSLAIGSAVHECILQPDEFYLVPKIGKPGQKLGQVFDEIDAIVTHTEKGKLGNLDNIIKKAAIKVDYYQKTIDNKIPMIRDAYLNYVQKLDEALDRETAKTPIILSDGNWDTAAACINSLQNDDVIQRLLFPLDEFADLRKDVFCEDAIFIDFVVLYDNHLCTTVPFKMKADNWNIDQKKKIVTLNDLKTTGKSVNKFMNEEDGSWNHYRYYRQLGIYMAVLKYLVLKEFGISENNGWTFKANICAVETIPHYWGRIFRISDEDLRRGVVEFFQLLKRVAAYQIFGPDAELEFI